MPVARLLLAVGTAGLLAVPAAARPAEPPPTPELFLKAARTVLRWDEPAEPTKVIGPIHFVGTQGLGAYLLTGSDGHILLYTGMPGSGVMIEKSITTLGFKPADVKLILTGHAHIDHVGGHADLKKRTGAKVAMLREEVELFESGGTADFHYGTSPAFRFDPVKVDTVFRDGDEIKLGDLSLTAHHTPGHTKGSTTYVTKVTDGGTAYTVVFPDGTGVNPGYRLGMAASYPGIAADYRKTFRVLEGLKPDVWLAPHNEVYGLDAKRKKATADGAKAWVDLDGYAKWVAAQKAKFEAQATAK